MDHPHGPVNSWGYLRVMFAVEDLDDTLARLRKLGATVVDEVVDYQDTYRLCYIRGPEGILSRSRKRPAAKSMKARVFIGSRPWPG